MQKLDRPLRLLVLQDKGLTMGATLLLQSATGGVLLGGVYGLLAMGLSLSWGLLKLVNLSHFALAFLAAYIVYELGITAQLAIILIPGAANSFGQTTFHSLFWTCLMSWAASP